MKITETKTEDFIQLSVEGRVDTTTSPELQQMILAAFQKGNYVILDFEKVDYVSSAGLRALLLGEKTAKSKGGRMVLRNVQRSVNEVFHMSGFSSILTIEP